MAKHKWNVADDAPLEHKAIIQLVNAGCQPKQLLRAALTAYQLELQERLQQMPELYVQNGLFKGTQLYPFSLHSQLLPKYLGIYELEVQSLLKAYIDGSDCFLDIGCAEGFYVAGVARGHQIKSIGVDIDPRSKQAIEFISQANGVDHLVHFTDSTKRAFQLIDCRKLVTLVDVDGSELSVLEELNSNLESQLACQECILIVESDKESDGSDNTASIVSYLSHFRWNIYSITPQIPSNRFLPDYAHLSFLDQVALGCEGRPGGQCWIAARKIFDASLPQ